MVLTKYYLRLTVSTTTVTFAMLSSTDLLTGLPDSLEEVRVKSLPGSVYYIADFITKDEEIAILTKVVSVGP